VSTDQLISAPEEAVFIDVDELQQDTQATQLREAPILTSQSPILPPARMEPSGQPPASVDVRVSTLDEGITTLHGLCAQLPTSVLVGRDMDEIADLARFVPYEDDDEPDQLHQDINRALDSAMQGRDTAALANLVRRGWVGMDGVCASFEAMKFALSPETVNLWYQEEEGQR
jgi:hypothetical protein